LSEHHDQRLEGRIARTGRRKGHGPIDCGRPARTASTGWPLRARGFCARENRLGVVAESAPAAETRCPTSVSGQGAGGVDNVDAMAERVGQERACAASFLADGVGHSSGTRTVSSPSSRRVEGLMRDVGWGKGGDSGDLKPPVDLGVLDVHPWATPLRAKEDRRSGLFGGLGGRVEQIRSGGLARRS